MEGPLAHTSPPHTWPLEATAHDYTIIRHYPKNIRSISAKYPTPKVRRTEKYPSQNLLLTMRSTKNLSGASVQLR